MSFQRQQNVAQRRHPAEAAQAPKAPRTRQEEAEKAFLEMRNESEKKAKEPREVFIPERNDRRVDSPPIPALRNRPHPEGAFPPQVLSPDLADSSRGPAAKTRSKRDPKAGKPVAAKDRDLW